MKEKKKSSIFTHIGDFLISFLSTIGLGNASAMLVVSQPMVYEMLNRPVLSPPPIVFQIVWPILYILMGIAFLRVLIKGKKGVFINRAVFYFIIQLALNLSWSFIFFNLNLYALSFLWIILIIIFVVLTIKEFYKVDKVAAMLLIPYLLWLIFASYLSFNIWLLNEA